MHWLLATHKWVYSVALIISFLKFFRILISVICVLFLFLLNYMCKVYYFHFFTSVLCTLLTGRSFSIIHISEVLFSTVNLFWTTRLSRGFRFTRRKHLMKIRCFLYYLSIDSSLLWTAKNLFFSIGISRDAPIQIFRLLSHRVINGTQEKAGYSDPVSYPAFNYLPY